MSLDGIVVVNKPEGWTSHDVVAKMRGIAGTRRVGHLGTLDPIATGVLPVMIGQATRLARFWERSEKTYEAKIRFGFATTTYDRAGEPVGPVTSPSISREELEAALESMRGEIEQVPPPVSAKKVKGVPAYKLARKNQAVELAPVKVTIFELNATEVASTWAKLRIRCSAGTYVRSIAHELGQRLGCGAHVEELVRTQAGPFRLDQAWTLDELQGHVEEALVPAADLLPQFPPVYVDEETVSRIRQGRDFTVSPFRVNVGTAHVKAIDRAGKLVAIGKIALPHVYHPVIVLT
ncbi:MAG TPA: tRNA pseudouridine(55) synthase TruB [Bryobacteraceae bacterium]|nr:tRNA pseudouridine(55) synthase TruB [Bryobacteraceae bacterium]